MVAGHMTKKNGYWYLILMVRDETGRLKQKWISTHLRVEGNKKKAEAMLLAARREYTDSPKYKSAAAMFSSATTSRPGSRVVVEKFHLAPTKNTRTALITELPLTSKNGIFCF